STSSAEKVTDASRSGVSVLEWRSKPSVQHPSSRAQGRYGDVRGLDAVSSSGSLTTAQNLFGASPEQVNPPRQSASRRQAGEHFFSPLHTAPAPQSAVAVHLRSHWPPG